MNSVVELCQDSDIIGISILTAHYNLAVQVSGAISTKAHEKIIVWGGMHPTIRPEECMAHADYVCVGEGDKAVPELIKTIESGITEPNIKGIWYGAKRNGFGELTENLDSLPNRDLSFEDHWIIDYESGKYRELTRTVYAELCTPKYRDLYGKYRCYYRTSTSRGCPYHCTYCNNNVFYQNYTGHYRKRSIDNVISELKSVKTSNPFIELIHFMDDSFLSRSIEEINRFSDLYKKEIDLPFRIVAYPTSITHEKLNMLVDAGLCHVSMGIESGSQTTLKKYDRRIKPEAILRATRILNIYVQAEKLEPPVYDIICNNPFETEKEKYETLHIMYKISQPCSYSFYNLIPYPETEYYHQMKNAGLIHNETNQIYRARYKFEPDDYPTILMFCFKWIPKSIIISMNNKNVIFYWILYLYMKYKHRESIFLNTIEYARSVPKKTLIEKIKTKLWRI